MSKWLELTEDGEKMSVRMSSHRLTVAIKNAIMESFDKSQWIELGYMTGTKDFVEDHERLLRSLRFGDDDYSSCIFETLEHMFKVDASNLDVVMGYAPVRQWFESHEPNMLYNHRNALVSVDELRVSSDTVRAALSQAKTLVKEEGPSSGVDRAHTALHAYFQAVCRDAQIEHEEKAKLTALFSLIRQHHPRLQESAMFHQDATLSILRASSKAIEKINTLRNEASMAHPNANRLGEPEALFVINNAFSILNYLDAKISAVKR